MSLDIVVTEALPLAPSLEQDTVRAVRHGLADVLEWLGEDVGPKPGELTHTCFVGGKLFVSPAMHDIIQQVRHE